MTGGGAARTAGRVAPAGRRDGPPLGALLAAALATAALVAGCVRTPPPDLSRDAAGLLEQVRETQAKVRSVRGSARVGVSSSEVSGSLAAWLAAEKPDRVRIETFDFFGSPDAVLVAAGGRFSLYDPRAGVLYRGEATPENLGRLLPLPLPAAELATLICGSAPLLDGRAVAAEPDGGAMRLELAGDGGRELLWIGEGASVQAARLEPRPGSAAQPWQVSFEAFRRRAGWRMPGDAELRAPKAKVTLRWKGDLEVNSGIEPATFRLDPPRGARVVDLDPGADLPEVNILPRPATRP